MQHRDNATHEARMLYEEQRADTPAEQLAKDKERRAKP